MSTIETTVGPDDELVRICAEHVANHADFNARAGEVPLEEDPRWNAYKRTLAVVCDAKPQTLAGLAAKARAAKAEATQPDGTVVPEEEITWAWDIVEDLIRLDDPDAQLIEACNEFLRIERAYEAACQALGDKDIEPDDPANEMLAPVELLTEKIVALRAVTADGFLARARCAAFFYRPEHSACQDDPEEGCDSRFMAAILRDAVRLNGETDR
jgi:hypothetical protein